jgi:hypothetical protein
MPETRTACHSRAAILLGTFAAAWSIALPSASAMEFDFRAQAQAIGLGAMSLPDPAFGVAELQVNASIWSLGCALGVAFERFPGPDATTTLYGGVFHAAFQWRFLALANDWLYTWLDPHVDLGFVLGGAGDGRESYFRGAGYGGLSLDFRIFGEGEGQMVATVQYRWSPTGVHAPDSAPDHLLLFGLGARFSGD